MVAFDSLHSQTSQSGDGQEERRSENEKEAGEDPREHQWRDRRLKGMTDVEPRPYTMEFF